MSIKRTEETHILYFYLLISSLFNLATFELFEWNRLKLFYVNKRVNIIIIVIAKKNNTSYDIWIILWLRIDYINTLSLRLWIVPNIYRGIESIRGKGAHSSYFDISLKLFTVLFVTRTKWVNTICQTVHYLLYNQF